MKRSMRNLRYLVITLVLIAGVVISAVPMAANAAPASGAVESAAYSGRYHVVKHGETLSHIARYYGVTVSAIKHANHLYSNTIYVGQHLYIPYPQSARKTGCSRVHVVKHGQTLSHIAKYYGTTTSALASANGIYNPSHIYVGQHICIPNIYSSGYGYHQTSGYGYHGYHSKPSYGGCVYVVQRGDTLSEIAKYYGYTTRQLAYKNGIYNWSHIYVGQHIRVC